MQLAEKKRLVHQDSDDEAQPDKIKIRKWTKKNPGIEYLQN